MNNKIKRKISLLILTIGSIIMMYLLYNVSVEAKEKFKHSAKMVTSDGDGGKDEFQKKYFNIRF